mgnify:CR=1 FL=1
MRSPLLQLESKPGDVLLVFVPACMGPLIAVAKDTRSAERVEDVMFTTNNLL